jgi:hypothetical protein
MINLRLTISNTSLHDRGELANDQTINCRSRSCDAIPAILWHNGETHQELDWIATPDMRRCRSNPEAASNERVAAATIPTLAARKDQP